MEGQEEVRLVAMTRAQARQLSDLRVDADALAALAAMHPGEYPGSPAYWQATEKTLHALAEDWDSGITEEELGPVRDLIRYRVEARALGDWSVALHDKLEAAFTHPMWK